MNRNGSDTSPYTQYLKNKYNVTSVVYMVHFNTESQAEVRRSDMDEFAIITPMQSQNVANIIEHETGHLYGAPDLYWNSYSPKKIREFANSYLKDDLMNTGFKVSPATAFHFGWLTWLDTPTWNVFCG
jgi:hypothetical protein